MCKKPKESNMNIFKKLFKKTPAPITETQKEESFDFVERYTLIDPKKVFINPEMWELCKKVPLACENENGDFGFEPCAFLDTSVMLPFVGTLKASPVEDTEPKSARTVSVVRVNEDVSIYVLPVLPICKAEEKYWLYWVNDKKPTRGNSFPKGWSFHMTPQINRALAAQMKSYAR